MPSLTVDGVNLSSASNTVSNLIPGITFQLLAPSATETGGGLEQVQVIIGNDNTDVESTVNQMVSDYNALISAINTQEGNTSSGTPEPLFGSPTLSLLQQQLMGGLNATNPNGSLTPVTIGASTTLSGSMTISVGGGTGENFVFGVAPDSPPANSFYTGSGNETLAGMAAAINSANIGVTAAVETSHGQSTLTLTSQAAGANGTLAVTSSIVASTPAPLLYSDTGGYTATTDDVGAFGSVANLSDALTGSMTIQVGNGTTENVVIGAAPEDPAADTIYTGDGVNTLSGLNDAINAAGIGMTAEIVTNGDGSSSLQFTSGTVGSAGAMIVTSNLQDTTSPDNTALNYTNSSDINSLTSLGISVNNDGSLTFDATSLDSVLNTDYSSRGGLLPEREQLGAEFLHYTGQRRHQLSDRGSFAGLKLQQQHRIHAECRYFQGRPSDLRGTVEPDRGAEPGQSDHAAVALPAGSGQRALLGDHRL